MPEVFCETDQPNSTARETEFFVIRLVDLGLNFEPRFLIREIHAAWSDSEQRIEWNVYCESLCCTPEDAQQHYAARKAAIVANGFNCSTQSAANFLIECALNGRMDAIVGKGFIYSDMAF
jgi:hypothetical protein